MSEVYEVTPDRCPMCGADWRPPGQMLRGWSSNPLAGGMGHRTWTCTACGHVENPQQVELRPTRPRGDPH